MKLELSEVKKLIDHHKKENAEWGKIILPIPYAIETKESIFGGQRQMIVHALSKPSQSFSVVGDKLFLNDECYDCYQSEYVKQ
jgi:hypothetical protein